MAAAVLELGLGNLIVAAALAVVAVAAGRWGGRPVLTHALWVLVLLKLVTPPVVNIPVRLLPPRPVVTPVVSPVLPSEPRPAGPPPQAFIEVLTPQTSPEPLPPLRKFEDFKPKNEIVITVRPKGDVKAKQSEKDIAANPADIPVFALEAAGPLPALLQPVPPVAPAASAQFPWPQVLLGVWAGGSAAWLGLVAWRVRRFTRVLKLAADPPTWFAAEVAAVARLLGLKATPAVKLVPGAVAPLLWSLGRPVVYFPANLLTRLTADQRAALVAHELAHLARADHRVRWLELGALAAYWWCPLAWFARRELQRAEEECCDACVLAALPAAGPTYAAALLDTLDFLAGANPPPPALASGMGTAAAVKRRLQLILDGRTPNTLSLRVRCVVVLAAALLLPVAPRLARLAAAEPETAGTRGADTPRSEEPTTATAPVPKDIGKPMPAARQDVRNPRGEPLVFEPRSTDIRPRGAIWWATHYTPQPFLAVAVSPDSSLVAAAGEGTGVTVWNRHTGQVVAELTGHGDVVSGLAFSPDGKAIATGSYDKTVKLWDVTTGKERRTLAGHTGWVFAVAFSPDGKTIATGSYDKTVRLWDAATGTPLAAWRDHSAGVRTVAFSPDGRLLASAGGDRIILVWDVAAGKVVQSLKGHKGTVRSVAFAPDGQTLASGSEDRTVKVWDVAAGQERQTLGPLPDMATCVRFSPKGQTLVATTFSGQTVVFDPVFGRRRQALPDHTDAVTGVAFADDGKSVVTVSLDQTVRLWPAGKPVEAAPAAAFETPGTLPTAVAASPDGKLVVVGDAAGTVTTWDVATGRRTPFLNNTFPGGVAQVAVSADLRVAAVGRDETIIVGHFSRDLVWKTKGRAAVFSPDGKHVAVAVGKGAVLFEADTGKEVRRFENGHDAPTLCLAFSPDGKTLATAGEDTRVRFWTVADGTKGHATAPLRNLMTISHLTFSPTGDKLAVAANNPDHPPPDDMTGEFQQVVRAVYVLPVPTADNQAWPPALLHPNDHQVTGVAWAAGGRGVISAATDGVVRVWNPDAAQNNPPKVAQSFRGHDAAILTTAVAAEAGLFVTAGDDLTVKQWRMPEMK